MSSFLVRKIVFYILSLFVGLIFIFSAYTKIIAIEPFEWTIAETNICSFELANILSRIIIAMEFGLGLLFICNIPLRQYVYTFAVALLLLFNIYLLWIMHTYGYAGNCGCFGQTLLFTPMEAYLKNCLLLFIIYYLSFYSYKNIFNKNFYIAWALVLIGFLYTFIKEPPDFFYIKDKEKKLSTPINLDAMYKQKVVPPFNYKVGKHIICILSTHCHHCKSAARKMHAMLVRNPSLPIYIMYAGDSVSLQEFFKETLAQNIPYQQNDSIPFLEKLTEGATPTIFWVQNGMLIQKSNYFTLSQTAIEKWIQKPE